MRQARAPAEEEGIELVDCTDASLGAAREALATQLKPCLAIQTVISSYSFRGMLSLRACCYCVDHILSLGTISTLALTDGVLDDERTRVLCDGLARRNVGRALTSLDVSANDLGDEGFETLLLALHQHSRVSTLRACNNSLGSLAVALLCTMSDSFATLRELDLSRNNLTGEAGLNFGSFIARGRLPIRRLQLRGCCIRGAGMEALLSVRHKLDELDVTDN